MRRLSALLFGIAFGGGLVYFGFNFHLVRANDGWLMVPRTAVALDDACVDIRQWDFNDWRKHPKLSRDMLKAGYGNRIRSSVQEGLVEDALEGLGLTRRTDDDEKTTR